MSMTSAQCAFSFPKRGGRRPGAGRKPKGERAGVSHAARPAVAARLPVLITMKVVRSVCTLRSKRAFNRIWHALRAARGRFGVRIVHFSVQKDHVHLIVEAPDAGALARAMQGLSVRIARALNRVLERSGTVFADRYHERVLTSPKQTRNCLAYVLGNAKKHGIGTTAPSGWVDAMSSAPFFDGWRIPVHFHAESWTSSDPPTSAPESFFLRGGWRRGGGLLDPDRRPGPAELRR